MGRFYSRLFLLAVPMISVMMYSLSAQQTGIDPKITQTHATSDDRSFKAMEEWVSKKYAGTPVKGNHKRALRTLHYWERRLDTKGNVFNHVRANLQELEQLYIDTFPALIQGDWQHIGPLDTYGNEFNQEGVGRISQIYFASAGTWYAATAGGGLWRTDLAGIYPGFGDYPWYPLTDSLPVMSISGIEVHPENVDDIYILTGDGNYSNTIRTGGTQPSIGILHSSDGGIMWDPTALTYDVTQIAAGFKLIRYPGSIDTMFAACTDGLYRTNDGWITSATQLVSDTCYDIEFKPDDPQIIYAACDGALRRSTNGGTFFPEITGNLDSTNISPPSVMGRIAIAVTPDNPDLLYVVIAKESDGGLASFQVSHDGGDSFVELVNNNFNLLASNDPVEETDGQGNYDLCIWADPNNANTVIVGGVNLWKSTSGGINWVQLVHWADEPPEYTHADIHVIESNPFTGDIVVGSDGGVYISSDGGFEWENRGRGLGITQFYHLDVWTDFLGLPFVSGGSQDNGTSAGLGLSDPTFEMVGGGDGFRTYRGTSDGDHMRYRSSQNGRLFHQLQLAGFWNESEITPDEQLDDNGKGKGLWDTPYQPNPNNFDELLAGYDNLYYGWDNGDDWLRLDYPNSVAYDGTRLIRQIAWSKLNGNTIFFYVADTTRRHLYKCETFYGSVLTGSLEQASCTIQNLDTIASLPTGTSSGLPTDLALSGFNTDEVWMSFAGYTDSMKVFYNQDITTGQPWVNISYNLPNTPVHCVEWDTDGIFAGTDIGVFFLRHGENLWVYFSKGLPTVAVTEIEVRNTVSGKLVFASTWGRGIWWSTAPTPVRRTRWYVDDSATGADDGSSWTNAFTNLESALAIVFPGDSIWVAEGTYYPPSANGFSLLYDNVRIWGGFSGTENAVSQRDFTANPTILSGDIGVQGDSTDNANHVFVFGGNNGNVLLDGFHITEGFAKANGENSNGGGIYYSTGSQSGKPLISNCKIYNNTCLGGGGLPNHIGFGAGMYVADYVSGDPPMYIIKCTFENNISKNRGGALAIDAYKNSVPVDTGTAVVFLDSCTFIGNEGNSEGGAIYIDATRQGVVKLFIDSCLFDGNRLAYFAGTGGGIAGDVNPGGGGTIELGCSNTQFINHCIAIPNADGGAVYLDGTSGTIISMYTECTFDNNQAGQGAAVYNHCSGSNGMSALTFDNCTLTNNMGSAGGALFFNSPSLGTTEVNMTNCLVDNNSASGRGGAIYFSGDGGGRFNTLMDSCTFTNNTAGENGAIRFYLRRQQSGSLLPGIGNLTISKSLFEGNSASGSAAGGAMVLLSNASVIDATITNTDFVNNSTITTGGAVAHTHTAVDTSRITVEYSNCEFSGNSVSLGNGGNGGAALSFNKTDAVVNQCVFTENVGKWGGAVYNSTGGFNDTYTQVFTNCQFIRNQGTERGGAFYSRHDDPSLMDQSIIACVFDSNYNTANAGNGGAYYTHGEGRAIQTISNSTFIDNFAKVDGGAMYIHRTTGAAVSDTLFMYVEDCTFTNNDAGTSGETIDQFGNNEVIITQWSNCDFYNDEADPIFRNRKSGANVSIAIFSDCTIQNGGGALQSLPNVPIIPSLFTEPYLLDLIR